MTNPTAFYILTASEFMAMRQVIVDLAAMQHSCGNFLPADLYKALNVVVAKCPTPCGSYADLLSTDSMPKEKEETCEEL